MAVPAPATRRILVVDDDPAIRRMLERTLQAEGYDTAHGRRTAEPRWQSRSRGRRTRSCWTSSCPASTATPSPAGCATRASAVPILLLTARDAVADRVAGLDAGADDYLVKPFAADELTARLRALLRGGGRPRRIVSYGDLSIDPATRVASRAGTALELTSREADLLLLLVRNAGRVVSRDAGAARRSGAADGCRPPTPSTATSPTCGRSWGRHR